MFALAVIPSIILFAVIWKHDTVEKEPPGLLVKLFLLGGLTIISATILELAGEAVLGVFISDTTSLRYVFLENFVTVALVEEGGKYFVLKKATWKNREFNYTFDGVVYAVVVSLGFATIENIFYLIDQGIGLAIARALLSVPGHVIDAVFMGYYYGLARYSHGIGDTLKEKIHLRNALLVPVMLHGFYDFCLSADQGIFFLLFILYEIIITVVAIRHVKRLSKKDTLIPDMEDTIRDNGKIL